MLQSHHTQKKIIVESFLLLKIDGNALDFIRTNYISTIETTVLLNRNENSISTGGERN